MDVGTGRGDLILAMSKMMNDQGNVIGIKHMKDLIDFGIKNISKHDKGLLDDKKIKLILGEGRLGCKTEGPFDCIHVSGVACEPPTELFYQHKVGGRLVIPLYKSDEEFIYIMVKSKDELKLTKVLSVWFSPLTSVKEQLNLFNKNSKSEKELNIKKSPTKNEKELEEENNKKLKKRIIN